MKRTWEARDWRRRMGPYSLHVFWWKPVARGAVRWVWNVALHQKGGIAESVDAGEAPTARLAKLYARRCVEKRQVRR